MGQLENRWHELPCGARVRVLNGFALAVIVEMVIDPKTGAAPPTDCTILAEATELLGHPVELSSDWESDITAMYKTANLRKKFVLDKPEQV